MTRPRAVHLGRDGMRRPRLVKVLAHSFRTSLGGCDDQQWVSVSQFARMASCWRWQ